MAMTLLRLIVLLVLVLALTGLSCHPTSRVVFDETHFNLHSISNPTGYQPLADLLIDDGYEVEAWTTPGQLLQLSDDVDILVVGTPQVALSGETILAVVAWVEDGGSLLLITDHDPFPIWANGLAYNVGALFRNDTILHDGLSHCPPGIPSCLQGRFSFDVSHVPSFFAPNTTHVTSYAGTSFVVLPQAVDRFFPVLRYEAPASAAIAGANAAGEHLLGHFVVGSGLAVLAGEAGMWTCRNNGLPIGWCPSNVFEDGEFNDDFILNVFSNMAWHALVADL